MATEPISIEGLAEFQASLRKLDRGLPRELRLVLNEAADLVVEGAREKVPVRSGRARGSIRSASQQRVAQVKAGGARVPYYGWLDFGGTVGRADSVRRPFFKEGRYLYPSLARRRTAVEDSIAKGLSRLARRSGLRIE